jgi:general secretion pathway protein L
MPKVVVALSASQVLRKTITLPAATEENLEQVLAYDLDRHTPFKPDEVYFDAVVVGRDSRKGAIRVDWAAALRSTVDQARRRAEGWGAAVAGVTPESPGGATLLKGAVLNLLPKSERVDAAAWRRVGVWLPVSLLVLVAVAAVALPIWQKRGYAIALGGLAGQVRVQAEAASALREQLERLSGDYNFALQRKYAFPSALQIVEDVTRLLPDDTWLTQFEVKSTGKGKDARREMLVRGESANAGRLISLLEDSKLFEQAAPRSPTTKIQPGPGEIFDLGALVTPLPLPAAAPVAGAPGAESTVPPPAPRAPEASAPATAATPAPAAPRMPDAAPAATSGAPTPVPASTTAAPAMPGPPPGAPSPFLPAPSQGAQPIPRSQPQPQATVPAVQRGAPADGPAASAGMPVPVPGAPPGGGSPAPTAGSTGRASP